MSCSHLIWPRLLLRKTNTLTGKPYLTHEEINNGALNNKGLELVWVDDPVMAFFTQIQTPARAKQVYERGVCPVRVATSV